MTRDAREHPLAPATKKQELNSTHIQLIGYIYFERTIFMIRERIHGPNERLWSVRGHLVI